MTYTFAIRSFFLFLFLLPTAFIYGQGFTYPVVKNNGNYINDFVPKGWMVLDSASGDLNKDSKSDWALVLQHKDSATMTKTEDGYTDTVITQPRMLVILFKDAVGNDYSLAAQNNDFILNHDNPSMEDPYQDIKIVKGILQVDLQTFYNMGSWYVGNYSYKFRYQNNDFVLIGADYYSMHRASMDYESYSYNFLTRKRIIEKGNEEKGTKKTSTKVIDLKTLKTLKTMKLALTWQVETDIYL